MHTVSQETYEGKDAKSNLDNITQLFRLGIERNNKGDIQEALEKLEKAIDTLAVDEKILLRVADEPVKAYSVGRDHVDRYEEGDLAPNSNFALNVAHTKLHPYTLGQVPTKRTVYFGENHMRMIEFSDLAEALSNGAELCFMDKEIELRQHEKFREMTVAQRHAFYLQARGDLNSPLLIEAFSVVDRGDFIPITSYEGIFLETGIDIGHGQVNSWPTVVAGMLEKLQPQPGDRVLDVGSGSGWTTALLAYCVGETGAVVGTEKVKELVDFGRENIGKYRHTSNSHIHHTPDTVGWSEGGLYDKILVSAQIDQVPGSLVDQLCEGGSMLIPIVHTNEEIVGFVNAYAMEKGTVFSEEDIQKILEDNKKHPRSRAVLYKKIDGHLIEVDVINELTFVPLVLG